MAAAAVGLVVGGTLWWGAETPRQTDGRLNTRASRMFRAVGAAVLQGVLPAEPAEREHALAAWLTRMEATISALPPATQAELDQLIVLLTTAPSRLALTGLSQDWSTATPQEVKAALQAMQLSTLSLRQQVFHALRDLTNGAYFAAPQTWLTMGYPGPMKV
jgi:hypothetical protein